MWPFYGCLLFTAVSNHVGNGSIIMTIDTRLLVEDAGTDDATRSRVLEFAVKCDSFKKERT